MFYRLIDNKISEEYFLIIHCQVAATSRVGKTPKEDIRKVNVWLWGMLRSLSLRFYHF